MKPRSPTLSPDPIAGAALLSLLTVSAVMLLALVTQTPPHPPLAISLFALAPFLAASLALGSAALYLCGSGGRAWRITSIAFAVSILPSFGPQKLMVPEIGQIWPAVLVADASLIVLVFRLTASFRNARDIPTSDASKAKT